MSQSSATNSTLTKALIAAGGAAVGLFLLYKVTNASKSASPAPKGGASAQSSATAAKEEKVPAVDKEVKWKSQTYTGSAMKLVAKAQQHSGLLLPLTGPGQNVQIADDKEPWISECLSFETRAWPDSQKGSYGVIESYIKHPDVKLYVYRHSTAPGSPVKGQVQKVAAGALLGFACVTDGPNGVIIGPLFGRDRTVALELVVTIASELMDKPGQTVSIGIPLSNASAKDMCVDMGLQPTHIRNHHSVEPERPSLYFGVCPRKLV